MPYALLVAILFFLIILVCGTIRWMLSDTVQDIRLDQFLNAEWLGKWAGFGACYSAIVLLAAALLFATVDACLRGDLAADWSKNWRDVGPFLTLVASILILLSWLSPGLFWVRMQPWANALSDDRESTENWQDNGRPATPLKLNRTQLTLVRKHRACAMSWLAFWVLVPPLWFWFEYVYATSGMEKESLDFVRFNDIQDRAKNIWIAWTVALTAWHGVRGTPLSSR